MSYFTYPEARNRALGISNAYSHHGRLCFELSSDEITDDDPFGLNPVETHPEGRG